MKNLFYSLLIVSVILTNIIFIVIDRVCIDIGMIECIVICGSLMGAVYAMGKVISIIANRDDGRKEMGRR